MDQAPVVYVNGETLTLQDVVAVARGGATVALGPSADVRARIERCHELNLELLRTGRPIYGVTTGFGDSVNRQVGMDRLRRVPEAQIRKNGCGRGPYLPEEEARAVLLARVNCLARGYSGVRPLLVDHLLALLNRRMTPCIREIGSVGASGDLIPGSYIAAVLMGQREVYYRGRICPSAEALAAEGMPVLTLEPKEGLAMTNGTQFMTGLAMLAAAGAEQIAEVADVCSAMAVEALVGIKGPFHPFLQAQKPHPGQVRSAANMWRLLDGSELARDYNEVVKSLGTLERGFRVLSVRIQDKYSLRCAPQFIGALYDAAAWTRSVLEVEINSSNDNPLFELDTGQVHSGGNFTGAHVALVMDMLRTAAASVADLIDRQFALLVDDKFNQGLTPGLIAPLPDDHPDQGVNHGFKGMQLLMSSLTAEALNMCMPMSVFSRSTAAHNQDKVSMGATASRKTRDVIALVEETLAVHLIGVCQAIDIRGAEGLGPTRAVYELVRSVSKFMDHDRELEADIQGVVELIRDGSLARAIQGITQRPA